MNNYKSLQELFSDPSRWTKHTNARKANGDPTTIDSEKTVCWCLSAGVLLIYPPGQDRDVYMKLHEQLTEHKILSVITYNDDPKTTIEDIQHLVKVANV